MGPPRRTTTDADNTAPARAPLFMTHDGATYTRFSHHAAVHRDPRMT
jgi:hypothetical protein